MKRGLTTGRAAIAAVLAYSMVAGPVPAIAAGLATELPQASAAAGASGGGGSIGGGSSSGGGSSFVEVPQAHAPVQAGAEEGEAASADGAADIAVPAGAADPAAPAATDPASASPTDALPTHTQTASSADPQVQPLASPLEANPTSEPRANALDQAQPAYPKTGSPEWEALAPEQKQAASANFYGMDPELKRFYEPPKGIEANPPIEIQYWRKHPVTGEMQRLPVKFFSTNLIPGERIYAFMRLDTNGKDVYMRNQPRVGFAFHARTLIPGADGKGKLAPYYSLLTPQNVKLDGQPSTLWSNPTESYIEQSKSIWPTPRKDIKAFGHKMIEEHVEPGVLHYISFEYEIPKNVWSGAFSYGSGSTGTSGDYNNTIGARATGFKFGPMASMDVRYVLDSDYRKALGIKESEEKSPLVARKKQDSYDLIQALEGKQIAKKSPLWHDGYEEYLFPLKDTYRMHDKDGNVVTLENKYFSWGPATYPMEEKPTYQSLLRNIEGYRYVADDFELNTNKFYADGKESKLPMFDYDYDPVTGTIKYTRHFYVTYEKLPEPPTPPVTPPEQPPATPPAPPAEPPATPPAPLAPPALPKTGDASVIAGSLARVAGIAAMLGGALRRRKKDMNA
ncbi:LPXTG cell wall anchor domain-containing protein [Collinsella sp. AGMB00827]|uniref:LPXTG cell wall anchor domain-containing protein n=1 Tax=Collinsella ureilytica TaxID=2869515 RepID=A0ABS7MLS2_9ACTN|nr:LPXTG cell wall anchor domain-containing protein [Collinsella urealyticum]MBY4798304.1 LPXTG cell wall anchor domain-containing protein [Collinsella urealyticum]